MIYKSARGRQRVVQFSKPGSLIECSLGHSERKCKMSSHTPREHSRQTGERGKPPIGWKPRGMTRVKSRTQSSEITVWNQKSRWNHSLKSEITVEITVFSRNLKHFSVYYHPRLIIALKSQLKSRNLVHKINPCHTPRWKLQVWLARDVAWSSNLIRKLESLDPRDHVCTITAGLEPLQSNHWSKILTHVLPL